MRKIVLLLAMTVLVSVNAQKKAEDYKWMFSVGANVVDFRVPTDLKGVAKDYIGFDDANFSGIPLRATLERKLSSAFGVQLGASMNKICRTFGTDVERVPLLDFLGFDLKLNYDVNNLIGNTGFFDPFINLGGGYSKVGEKGDFKANLGYGANLWVTKRLGIKLESSYNHAFNPDGTDYFQHTVGLAYRFGRSDRDKDGIVDAEDACPDTPGLKEFKGCPDTDGDGIKDSDDACPKVAGLKELNGCPDTDGDGVKDSADKCPKEVGPKENEGCPWPDTDGDGVTDNLDKCPKEAGDKADEGCPKKEVVETAAIDEAASNQPDCSAQISEINQVEIYFDFDKANIKSTEKAKLDRVAELFKTINCAGAVKLVYLSGYADVRGSQAYNSRLSERRALAVKSYLESKGVTNFTLESRGLGETDTRSDYIFNRRVEIKIE